MNRRAGKCDAAHPPHHTAPPPSGGRLQLTQIQTNVGKPAGVAVAQSCISEMMLILTRWSRKATLGLR